MKFYYIIKEVFTFAPLLPFSIGLLKYKYLSRELKTFFYLMFYCAASEMLAYILTYFGNTTIWGFHFYVPIEFFLYSLVYSYFLDGIIQKKIIYLIIVLFLAFSILNTFFNFGKLKINNYVLGFRSIIYIIYSVLFFYKVMDKLEINKLWNEPRIWINIGVLISFSLLFFVFILSNYLLTFPIETAKLFLGLPTYFSGIGYILMAIGLLKVKKQPITK